MTRVHVPVPDDGHGRDTTGRPRHARDPRDAPDRRRGGSSIRRGRQQVDETLRPHGAQFVIHGGGPPDVLEGSWDANLTVIAFPDAATARRWYTSEAHQAVAEHRRRAAAGALIIVEGCTPNHRAADLAARIRGS